jgi:spore coat-associated protein N
MSRIDALIKRPKRTLGVLALVLVAVGVAVGTGADFSAQSANPGNTFTAGTLTMSNSKNNAAILTVGTSNMKPGDTATGTVDIGNTGSIAGDFELTRDQLTNSDNTNPMSDQIDLVVEDCGTDLTCGAGDTNVYTGTLTAMNATFNLGSFPAGTSHRYEFTATFNASAGNVYQGDNTSARFVWDAVQS